MDPIGGIGERIVYRYVTIKCEYLSNGEKYLSNGEGSVTLTVLRLFEKGVSSSEIV